MIDYSIYRNNMLSFTAMIDFCDLPLYRPFIETLAESGIRTATPIQEQVIPLALAGKSVLFESETGTGKTLAFLLPLLTHSTG